MNPHAEAAVERKAGRACCCAFRTPATANLCQDRGHNRQYIAGEPASNDDLSAPGVLPLLKTRPSFGL